MNVRTQRQHVKKQTRVRL